MLSKFDRSSFSKTNNGYLPGSLSRLIRRFELKNRAQLSSVVSFILLVVAFVFVLAGSSPVSSQSRQSITSQGALLDDGRPAFAPGEVVVKIRARTDDGGDVVMSQAGSVIAGRYQLRETGRIDALNVFVYQLPDGADVLSAVSAMSSDASIEWAEPNYYRYVQVIPNDPSYRNFSSNGNLYPNSLQRWAFNGHGNDRNLNAEAAWNLTSGRTDVVIAVIDSGVLLDDPDLTQNIWKNTKDPVNGLDDDGNGYVDDVNGWDFRGNTYSGPSKPDNNPNPDVGDGLDNDSKNGPDSTAAHGTFVASVAAARGDNATSIAGACWSCKIMPLKVFTDDGGATTSDIADAIIYAADNGATVINLSLSSSTESLLEGLAVLLAINAGTTVVAAAGNDHSSEPVYPAGFLNVISVGATDWGGDSPVADSTSLLNLRKRATFSQYGMDAVDVVAPGVVAGIKLVTKADEKNGNGTAGSASVKVGPGTSYSAPLVSGLAGLMISYARQINRPITNLDVRRMILDSATKLDDDPTDSPDGGVYWDNFGRVEFLEALKAIDGTGIRTVTLAPNVQQTGSISATAVEPVLGLTQYKVTVTNATQELRVTVSGSSNNLALFGELDRIVKTTQKTVYASYAGQGTGSNKTLVINRSSNPPLTSGEYYFAIGNFGPSSLNYSIVATVLEGSPTIGTQPSSINVGKITVGTTAEKSLSIQNSGTVALSVSGVSVSNARFSVTGPTLPFTVDPNTQRTITVKFSPIAAGVQSGSINLTSNDPLRPSLSIPVSGEGACNYSLSSSSMTFAGNGGGSSVVVTAPGGCGWVATANASWISFTSPVSGTGTGSVNFTVASNPGTTGRSGEIQIADQKATISQAGTAPASTPVVIVNAADFASDKILSPDALGAAFGQFKTVGGAPHFGSTIPLPTTLGGIRVTINGLAAGLGYAGPTQINLVVPSGVADGPATIVVTNVDNTTSSGTFTVVRSRPAIFQSNSSLPASAPAAHVTSDGVNYQFASNPDGTPRELSAGTQQQPNFLVLYLTGLRNTPTANPTDGNGVAESVIITFQGVQGIVDYAGLAPGYVGLDQANVRIPWALAGLGNISVKVFVSNGQGGMRESNQVTIRLGGQAPNIVSPPIMPGQEVNGALTNQDYIQEDGPSLYFFDAYSFQTTGPNASVAIDLRSGQFDSLILLYRVQGNTLIPIAVDDYTGAIGSKATTQDHALLFTVLAEQAQYVILATTAAPMKTGSYRLFVTANAVTPIQYGANLTNMGFVTTDVKNGADSYFDAYSFSGQQGDRVRITVTSNVFGPLLLLNRNNGTSVAVDENDEAEPTAQIDATLPQAGLYTILATPYDEGVTGAYTISLQKVTAGAGLAEAAANVRKQDFSVRKLPAKANRGDAASPLTREAFFEHVSRRRFVK